MPKLTWKDGNTSPFGTEQGRRCAGGIGFAIKKRSQRITLNYARQLPHRLDPNKTLQADQVYATTVARNDVEAKESCGEPKQLFK